MTHTVGVIVGVAYVLMWTNHHERQRTYTIRTPYVVVTSP